MNSAQNSLNLLNQTFKLSIRKTLKFIISTNAAELSKLYLIKARLKTGNNNKIQKFYYNKKEIIVTFLA
jgi:hypothetical protein